MLQILANDADNDTLIFSAEGLPDGLAINANTGNITGKIAKAGTFNSKVTVTDGTDNASVMFVWKVDDAPNQPPVITNPGDQSNKVGDDIMLQIEAKDADDDALKFMAESLPDGLLIDTNTGKIMGKISAKAGSFDAKVTVTDGASSVSVMFAWKVDESSNQAPVITNPGDQMNKVGDNIMLQIEAKGGENDTLSFSAEGLPTGLAISADAGKITGTTMTAGAFNSKVTVSNGTESASVMFGWKVDEISNSPVIGEVGTVVKVAQPNAETWHMVTLQQSYQNPIVVMGPVSRRGGHPVTVRVRNVSPNSFEFQLDEWDYLSGKHTKEYVGYMVVEAGTHTLSNGKQLVAGKIDAANQEWQTQHLSVTSQKCRLY